VSLHQHELGASTRVAVLALYQEERTRSEYVRAP
jgi:hypothetical protein